MPIESLYSPIHVQKVDIWDFLFERKDRQFPDDKGNMGFLDTIASRSALRLLILLFPVIFFQPDINRSYTYAQVRSTAIEFGKGLREVFHWQKNDVLLLFTPNCVDVPAMIWGCHWAGGIVSPANPQYTARELAFQLKDTGAKALVTQVSSLAVAREAAKMIGLSEDRIILVGDEPEFGSRMRHFNCIRRATDGDGAPYLRPQIDPKDDLAFLVYSSGTTGLPKGVMLTHENIVSNVQQMLIAESPDWSWKGGPDGQGEKIMGFLPFFHIYSLTLMLHTPVYRGLTVIIMPRFDLETFCRLVQEHKATFAYLAPPVVLLLAKDPIVNKYDLSSLQMLASAAAPLSRELADAMYERIKVPVKQAYGLSETSPGATLQRWEDWKRFGGSVGLLCPSVTAKIVDLDDVEVPTGQPGEIWFKGPNIFKGYLNNFEGTANAFSEDGYFKTGDIGYVDPNGNFYITDRLKELIKYKGFQVAPAELEGLLLNHPKVNDVAVIGVYQAEEATEVPRAYVVLAPGVEPVKETENDISQWLAARVTHHKRLRGGIRFVDEIPKSAAGKILRRVLKDRAQLEEGKRGLKSKL